MTRRLPRLSVSISGPAARWTVGVIAGALSLASCATFDEAHDVAEVGASRLNEDTFAEMVESPVAAQVLNSSPIGGQIPGESARGLIRNWVILRAVDEAGFIDAAAKTAAQEQSVAQYSEEDWAASPPEMQELVVLIGAINQLIGAGQLAESDLIAAVQEASVRIDPRYGRWDPDALSVEPLG